MPDMTSLIVYYEYFNMLISQITPLLLYCTNKANLRQYSRVGIAIFYQKIFKYF